MAIRLSRVVGVRPQFLQFLTWNGLRCVTQRGWRRRPRIKDRERRTAQFAAWGRSMGLLLNAALWGTGSQPSASAPDSPR